MQPLVQTVLQSPRLSGSAGATPGSSATSLSKPSTDEGAWSTFVDGAVGWWSWLWGGFSVLSAPPLSGSKGSAVSYRSPKSVEKAMGEGKQCGRVEGRHCLFLPCGVS